MLATSRSASMTDTVDRFTSVFLFDIRDTCSTAALFLDKEVTRMVVHGTLTMARTGARSVANAEQNDVIVEHIVTNADDTATVGTFAVRVVTAVSIMDMDMDTGNQQR